MLGTILGDIIGSPYEGFLKQKEKDSFPLFVESSRYTDDTVMTLAISHAFLELIENEQSRGLLEKWYRKIKIKFKKLDEEKENLQIVENSLREFGNNYPDAGYGYGFIQWLNDKNLGPYHSYGNGSAMRVSSIPWLFNKIEDVQYAARLSAMVTHNHPEGMKGAEAVASAIFLAKEKKNKKEIKMYLEEVYRYDLNRTSDDVRNEHIISSACMETVPEAIIAFLDGENFEDCVRNAVSFGGDTDTIAAITGGIAEAYYGVPADLQHEIYKRLPKPLVNELERFFRKVYHIREEI